MIPVLPRELLQRRVAQLELEKRPTASGFQRKFARGKMGNVGIFQGRNENSAEFDLLKGKLENSEISYIS